jgi:hypothetical protein
MKMRSSNSKFVAGAALMLALWALFLLSALIVSWALDIDSRLTLSGNANRALEAEALACSGAEVALHPLIKVNSPNLHRQVPPRGSYNVRITGEGGRLNLNWLLAGEDPVRLEVLRKYLEIKHVDLNERDRMIDCLLDWVDPDDLVRLNGAEREGDYQPANSLLTRIDELKKVKGWEQLTAAPGWDDDFTLNSAGPIDLAWASRDVLRALPGMTDAIVDRFLMARGGPDGKEETGDDAQFRNVQDIQSALGFSAEQFKQLAALVNIRDPAFRIVSTGKSGDVTRIVQMIVRKAGNVPQLVVWKEL